MQHLMPILVVVGIIALILVVGIFAHKAEKKRKATITSTLEALGFTVNMGGLAPGVDRVVVRLPNLRGGASNVLWSASLAPDGELPTWILEHKYTTGSGKNRRTHYHTVVATHCPQTWSPFTLTGESFFHRIGDSWGLAKDLNLENTAFNKRWRVKCEDDSAALVVLSPDVQTLLSAAPANEQWYVGRGVFACLWSAQLVKGDPAPMLQRLAAVVQTLPPEVRAMLKETPLASGPAIFDATESA